MRVSPSAELELQPVRVVAATPRANRLKITLDLRLFNCMAGR